MKKLLMTMVLMPFMALAGQLTVTFNANGGSGTMSSQTIPAGGSAVLKSNSFTRPGYRFVGWGEYVSEYDEIWLSYYAGDRIYADGYSGAVTLYAMWAKSSITITFDPSGGSVSPVTKTVSFGSSITLPTPSRNGCEFYGWKNACGIYPAGARYTYDGMDCEYDDFTFVADWRELWPTSYRTSFSKTDVWDYYDDWGDWQSPVLMDPGGATGSQRLYVVRDEYDDDGKSIVPDCPYSRQGYEFAGWAYYDACGHAESFEYMGTYIGGYVGVVQPGERIALCGVSALVATWRANSYTVTFNANGGSCSTSSKQYSSGSTLGTLPTATRSGYTFDGWYTSSSGGTKVTSSTAVTGAMTLYAHWNVSGSGVALTTALNVSGISFSNGGNATWFGQTAVSHDGSSAARSGQIGANQSSSMQTTVTGPADISFWWKVSSESVDYDYLEFLIDGVQQEKIGGTGGSWAQKRYSIGSGSHTLKWNYRKDGSVDEGDDCGWVDQLVVSGFPSGPSETYYVNGATGSDSNSGLSSSSAKKTIQAAINAAANGDTVSVSEGTYKENLSLAKRISLIAVNPLQVTINGNQSGHCINITSGAAGCVVDGFVLYNGAPTNSGNKYGGGIDCTVDATIRNCHFKDNGNSNQHFAGGIHTTNGAKVLVYNCLFTGNRAYACGGASLTEGESIATFDRCTVYGNYSDNYIGQQGGLGVANTGTIMVKNTIAWGNSGQQVAAYGSSYGAESTINISYSCVQGGAAANGAGHFTNGSGNISSDPKFTNAANGDFSLQSTSPCINAGNPSDTDPDGTRADMGFSVTRIQYPEVPGASTYTVTFNANGGSCSTSSKQYSNGSTLGTLPTATRSGYAFDGWYTASSGGTKVTSSTTVTRAVTYYAHWTKVATYCEVAFDVNGGEGGTIWRDVEMGKPVGTLPSPVRSKHKFLGWYTQRDGGTKISSSTKVTSDVTYYAHWQYDGSVYVQTVLSEYSEDMGTVSGGNKSVKGGSSVTLTAKAAKGCVFSRWYPVGVSDEEWDEFWNTHEVYNPTLKVTPGSSDISFEAHFISIEDDGLCISGSEEWNNAVGVPLREAASPWDCERYVEVEHGSLLKFTVSGVPTGVKYKVHNGALLFYGTPTKEGVYWVTYTAKNASGYQATSVIKWTIGNPKPTDYDDIGLNKKSDDWERMCNLLVGREIEDSLCVDNWNSGCAYCGDGEITKWAISGLPTGLKLQQNCHGRYVITGMPTKAGKFTMTITATYADRHTAKAVQTIVVEDYGSAYVKVAVMPGQEYMGSASGGGVCARASKAKLTAKANKGYVFAGWYDEDGNRWRNTDSGDWRKASDSYIVRLDEWPEFYARFVPQSSDRSVSIRCPSEWNVECSDVGNLLYDACSFDVDSASLPTVTASGLPSGCKFDKVNMRLVFEKQPQKPGISKVTIKAKNVSGATDERVIYVKVPNLRSDVFDGIDYDGDYRIPQYDSMECRRAWGFSVEPGWTVSVSGLPPGLKLVKSEDGTLLGIIGTATKAGAYTVTLTAKRGSVSEKATFTIIVDPLPSYAIGIFNGVLPGECYDCGDARGTFTMTSTASGKLSATLITELGDKYTFSANSWNCISDEECYAYFTKKGKSGCGDVEQHISVSVRKDSAWDDYQLTGNFFVDGCRVGGEGEIVAQRNPFGKVGKDYENWEAHSIAATLAGYGKMGAFAIDLGYGEYELACPNCIDMPYYGAMPDLTFTVTVDGAVKVAGKIGGKSVSGSSTLRVVDGEWRADFMLLVGKTPIAIRAYFEDGGFSTGSGAVGR